MNCIFRISKITALSSSTLHLSEMCVKLTAIPRQVVTLSAKETVRVGFTLESEVVHGVKGNGD